MKALAFVFYLVGSLAYGSVFYHSQIVTSLTPTQQVCHQNVGYHNDLVNNVFASNAKAVFFVVNEPQYADYNQVVNFVNHKQVNVIVEHNAFQRFGFTGFNQTLVACVRNIVFQGRVVAQQIVQQVRVNGFLTGNNASQVKSFVGFCR